MKPDPSTYWGGVFDDISTKVGDAEAANGYFSVRNFRFLKGEVLKLLGDMKGRRILDAGCGTAHISFPLAEENFISGVDFSKKMLGFARNKGLVPVQSWVERLPFKEGSFDLALANNIIHLIEGGELLIRELLRITRPGGRIIISTVNAENLTLGAFRIIERKKQEQFRFFSAAFLKKLIAEAGGRVRASLFLFYPFGGVTTVPGNDTPGFLLRRLATSIIMDAFRL